MTRLRASLRAAWVIGVMVVAVAVVAAPILPRQRLPDPVRSLAQFQALRYQLAALPPELTESRPQMVERDQSILDDHGVRVVDEPDAPTLRTNIYTTADEKNPSRIAYCIVLEFYQPVTLVRLDGGTLVVPTFTNVAMGISDRDELTESVSRDRKTLIEAFIVSARMASGE